MGTSDDVEKGTDSALDTASEEVNNPEGYDQKISWYYWCISSDDNPTDSYGIIDGELSYTSDRWLTHSYTGDEYEAEYNYSDTGGLLSSYVMSDVNDNTIYGITPGYSHTLTYYELTEDSGLWYVGYSTLEWERFPPDSDSRDHPVVFTSNGLVWMPAEEDALLETKFVFESEGLDLEDAKAFEGWIESEYEDLKALTVAKIGNLAKPVFNFQKTKSRPLRTNQLSLFTSEDVTETSVSVATSYTATSTEEY